LDSDRTCLDAAFIPEVVDMAITRIDEPHPLFVHPGLTVGIVPLKFGRGAAGSPTAIILVE
jgi:hypothetical protein